jgi:hypothetical protein
MLYMNPTYFVAENIDSAIWVSNIFAIPSKILQRNNEIAIGWVERVLSEKLKPKRLRSFQ